MFLMQTILYWKTSDTNYLTYCYAWNSVWKTFVCALNKFISFISRIILYYAMNIFIFVFSWSDQK